MKKLKELTVDNAEFYYPDELQDHCWGRGFPLSFCGWFVALWMFIIGKEPKSFYGVITYFEVEQKGGWGFECGNFFVCTKDASDALKAHELGHCVANANIGGFRTLGCSIGSMLRFWWRRITKAKTMTLQQGIIKML